MTIHQFIGEKVKYDSGYIWGINKKEEYQMLVQRGWGQFKSYLKQKKKLLNFKMI